jgi:hypothetical protein
MRTLTQIWVADRVPRSFAFDTAASAGSHALVTAT